ncbi:MAG: ABC transporter permease, partial [Bacteroidota bacterium]
FVERDFFKVFTYPLIQGQPNTVLENKNALVISESLAMKMFNTTEEVVGTQLRWESEEMKRDVVITGIFEDVPNVSSSQFDFVLSYDDFMTHDFTFHEWGNYGPYAYVLLREGSNVESVNKKIKDHIYRKSGIRGRTLFLAKYSDLYLHGRYENGVVAGGRIEYVRLFSLIAIAILIMACINFMNLSTAQASRRLKIVGVQKTLGATRASLISQFYGEAFVISMSSLLVASVAMAILLPFFSNVIGREVSFGIQHILPFMGIALFGALIAGSYPALYLSNITPIRALRSFKMKKTGSIWVRRGLVIFQFVVSMVLIVSVLVIYKQIEFIQTKDMGYNEDNILQLSTAGRASDKLDVFISEVKNVPGVVNASAIGHSLTSAGYHTYAVDWEGKNTKYTPRFEVAEVNFGMIETLGLSIKEGRSFSEQFGSEKTKMICNQKAIEAMSLEDPIGKQIRLWDESDYEIVGVVNDFHFESLREEIKPMLFIYEPEESDDVTIRIEGGREKEVLAGIMNFHGEYNPGYALEYSFLKDDIQRKYESERKTSLLSRFSAGLAILVSCLGLFGLAVFTVEQKTKEIGIRKTFGASTVSLFIFLNSEFTKIVIAALILAVPVSYFFVQNWLKGFAYRTDLEVWYFLGSAIVTLLVTWATIAFVMTKVAGIKLTDSFKEN